MKHRELGPWPYVAGAVVLGAGGILAFRKFFGAAAPAPSAPPVTCDPGYFFSNVTGQCEKIGSQSASLPSASNGPIFYPVHGKILVVGGELATNLANALQVVLAHEQAVYGIPAVPTWVHVWDGRPVLYEVNAFAEGVADNGVPASIVNDPPDLVIVMLGEFNAAYGPVNDTTVKSMAAINDALAEALPATVPNPLGAPIPRTNILWIAPWQKDLPHTFDLDVQMATLVLTGLGRTYVMAPDRSRIPMQPDGIRPTGAGYLSIAAQIASLLLRKYAADKCPANFLATKQQDGTYLCIADKNHCPTGTAYDQETDGCVADPSQWVSS